MKLACLITTFSVLGSIAFAQTGSNAATESLSPQTTLPIVFTRGVDSNHAHTGDPVAARTLQAVQLPNGTTIPSGAVVAGHIAAVAPFAFDRTPYAKQRPATLSVHFDSITTKTGPVALDVYVRALADPLHSWDARKPRPSDEDPEGTLAQIGGELLKPHEGKVINVDQDVVGYQRHGGVYAHLIPASGNSSEGCDGSQTEQSVALFSASACGLYGFGNTAMEHSGKTGEPSTLVLISARNAPEIWKGSTALLEVLPQMQTTAQR